MDMIYKESIKSQLKMLLFFSRAARVNRLNGVNVVLLQSCLELIERQERQIYSIQKRLADYPALLCKSFYNEEQLKKLEVTKELLAGLGQWGGGR